MKNTLILLFAITLLTACSTDNTPLLILDTDIGPDYDDAGAMACMYALESEGKCRVLGVNSSNLSLHTLPNIEIINHYYNRSDLPVGRVTGEGVNEKGWHKQSWSEYIATKYAPTTLTPANVPDAVWLYRKLLSESPDHSVTICTIGFLTNLSKLLESVGDEHSPLHGKELVTLKVKKLVVMGGGFPEGNEYNLHRHPDASIHVTSSWPTPIYFCGFEIGDKVLTGKETAANGANNNPVADIYRVALAQDNPDGRQSWDQLTVLAAIEGHEPYFNLVRGNILMLPDGRNRWENKPTGNHYYMIPKVPYEQLAERIEQLMMRPVESSNESH